MKIQKYNSKVKREFKTFKFLLVFLTFSFYLLTFHLREANAQQVSLALSPPLIELVIKPGKSVLIAYKLENRGDPTIMSAYILPFQPRDNLGNIKIKNEFDGPVRFNLDNSELKLNQPFFVKTGDKPQLLLRIRIPEGAPEGDYYYTLLAETQAPPSVAGTSAGRAKATIGSNILITVTRSGQLNIKGKLALFDVLSKFKLNIFGRTINFFESSDKIPVILVIDNKGRNMIKPQGEIVLRGNFGEKASYDIIPQNILAESQRLIMATSAAQIDCRDNRSADYCKRPISLLLSGFFVGHYDLSTEINFGTSTTNLYGSTSFIGIPIKLIIGTVFALVIGVLVIKKFSKEE